MTPNVARTYLKIVEQGQNGYNSCVLRVTDEQWELIRKHFPEERIPDGRPGRKPIAARSGLRPGANNTLGRAHAAVVVRYGPTHRLGTVRRVKRCGDATADEG